MIDMMNVLVSQGELALIYARIAYGDLMGVNVGLD